MEDRDALRDQMDGIYRTTPTHEIPWVLDQLPAALEAAFASRSATPHGTLDLGCGAGNYAVLLAARGFDVTGVDLSSEAIRLARERASSAGVTCRFEVADLVAGTDTIGEGFEFAYDWEVLHHVFPVDRPAYFTNVHRLLAMGATYLSVCFSEESTQFGGEGKVRTTPINTQLYFSSEQEFENLLAPLFEIQTLDTIEIPGKYAPHPAIHAVVTKR